MTAALAIRDLDVRFGDRLVLAGLSIAFSPGGVTGLIGPNGAGKTTLLRAAAGLAPRSSGEIALHGRPIDTWTRRARARVIGYLPQEKYALWPVAAARLVTLGRLPHLGPWDRLPEEDEAAVVAAMKATDVSHLAARPVTELSGGELTRVLIARLLAGDPSVILADEPVAGLDPAHAMQVLAIFRTLAREGRTVVVVLHDLTLAARYCDHLVLIDQGTLAAAGAPRDVLTSESLARYYGVGAEFIDHGGERFIIPRALSG